jgi:hypothetical protein
LQKFADKQCLSDRPLHLPSQPNYFNKKCEETLKIISSSSVRLALSDHTEKYPKYLISVLPSLTLFGEIHSVYPGFAIIIAIGLCKFYAQLESCANCRMFIDLLDDAVMGY